MPRRDLRPNTPIWLFGKTVVTAFYYWYLRMKVEGEENVPSEGPLLLVSNHLSSLDPFAIGVACHRRVVFLAKEELFRVPVLATVVRHFGAIPIDRRGGDTVAIRAAVRVIRAGKVLGMFPEGTRSTSGELRAFREGAAKLALRFEVPILPVAISGTNRAMPPGTLLPRPFPIAVRFGPLLRLEQSAASDLAAAAETIRGRIALLLGS